MGMHQSLSLTLQMPFHMASDVQVVLEGDTVTKTHITILHLIIHLGIYVSVRLPVYQGEDEALSSG